MPAMVLEAVDAQDLTERDLAAVYRPGLHRPRYPFPLRMTEVACFLSHREAWRQIVENGLDAGLVVEDDVELLPGFGSLFNLALTHATVKDFVRFPKKVREHGAMIAVSGAGGLFEPRLVGLGTPVQLVGRDAAVELLAFTQVFDRPVDTTIQMRWLHGVCILSTSPLAVREVAETLGGTTIQAQEKPLREALSRETKRAWYRLAVRGHNFKEASAAKWSRNDAP